MPEYISMEELAEEISKSLSGMNPKDYQYFDGLKNYRLWSRLAAFYPYFNELDNKEIKCIKTKSLRSDKDV